MRGCRARWRPWAGPNCLWRVPIRRCPERCRSACAPAICGWAERRIGQPVLMLAASHYAVAWLILALLAGRCLPPAWDAAIFALIGAVMNRNAVISSSRGCGSLPFSQW